MFKSISCYCCLMLAAVLISSIQAMRPIQWIDSELLEDDITRFVIPSSYSVQLNLLRNETVFTGSVKIELKLKQGYASCELTNLVLHADLSIDIKQVRFVEDAGSNEVPIRRHYRDANNKLISFELRRTIIVTPDSKPMINLTFEKKIVPIFFSPIRWSMFMSDHEAISYGLLDLTKPQAPRNVFPCFDIDSLRATIFLSVSLDFSTCQRVLSISEPMVDSEEPALWRFSVPHSHISLRSLAVVIGDFEQDGHDLTINTLLGSATNLSPPQDTHAILNMLYQNFQEYFGAPLPAGKLDIVIVPDLSCYSEHTDDVESNQLIYAWGLLIGTRDSLLISNRWSDPIQSSTRILNLSRAIAHQYLAASYGWPSGNESWHLEMAAAQVATLIRHKLYPSYFALDPYVRVDLASAAMEYNAEHDIQLNASAEVRDMCRPRKLVDSRFYKALALGNELVEVLAIEEERHKALMRALFNQQQQQQDEHEPHDQLSTLFQTIGQSAIIDRMLRWRTSLPTYNLIELIEDENENQILFRVSQFENNTIMFAGQQEMAETSERRRNIEDVAAIDDSVFVLIKIEFIDTTIPDEPKKLPSAVVCSSYLTGSQRCAIGVPPWFAFNNERHVVVVSASFPSMFRFMRFAYSPKLFNKLVENFQLLNWADREQVIEDLRSLSKYNNQWLTQLSKLVAASTYSQQLEDDTNVRVAYLRVRATLSTRGLFANGDLASFARYSSELNSNLSTLLQQFYDNDLLNQLPTDPLYELRYKAQVTEQLIDIGDDRIFHDIIDQNARVPPNTSQACYNGLVFRNATHFVNQLIFDLTQTDDNDAYDEKVRLAFALSKSFDISVRTATIFPTIVELRNRLTRSLLRLRKHVSVEDIYWLHL